jgi:hypothetical protein
MNRRSFLFAAAASALGGSAVVVGCASTETAPRSGRLLDGVSLEVHRDPG